jgi:large subunit ribosomal protein L21
MFWRLKIYAIIETGGKQYKVTEGQTIDVERIEVADGDTVELDRVLMVADGEKVTLGNPVIEGAKVKATAKESGKGDKVIVFKYKSKVRYRRKNGHRQLYTRLIIDNITAPGMVKPKPARAEKPAREAKAVKAAKAVKETKPTTAAKPATVKKTTRRKKKEETADGA